MEPTRHLRRLCTPALAGLAAFVLLGLIWVSGNKPLFFEVETQWGIWPGAYPFSDLEVLLSGIECKRIGVDAYVTNPCDTFGRIFDYPPAWLALAVLPVTTGWMNPAGIALSLAFFASLLLLPAARSNASARLVAAGVLSSTTLFAVERGNNDLVVFILIALAAALIARSRRAALAGYALIQAAGLLKYFPLGVFALALREAPARLLAIAAAAIGATALFAALHHEQLASALSTIPFGSPFRLVFGASNLGGGLVLLGASEAVGRAVTLLLVMLGLGAGVMLGLRRDAGEAAARLSVQEQVFYLAGAAMVLGSFFTAQNVNYRAVHMLLMLPALTALRDLGAARRYASLVWVGLGLLWMDFFRIKILAVAYLFTGPVQHLIEAVPGFLLREVLWWWLAVHGAALATAILRDAPVAAPVLSRFARLARA